MKKIKATARELAPAVLWVVLVGLVMVGIVGCAPASVPESPRPKAAQRYPMAQSVDTYDLSAVYLHDVRLKDGTRCVYVYNAGIDCDFRSERGPE